MGSLGDGEVISTQEALERGFGGVVDAHIRQVAAITQEINVLGRRAASAAKPAERIACAQAAQLNLTLLRGIIALDEHDMVQTRNLDLVEAQLAELAKPFAHGPMSLGAR